MDDKERRGEPGSELARVASDALQRIERRGKRATRTLVRWAKIIGLMWFVTFAIVIGMISTGNLFGPTGSEGLLLTPLMLLTAYAAILFWFRKPKPGAPARASQGDLPKLVAQTSEWLVEQGDAMPANARQKLDSIVMRLESLTPQLRALPPNTPSSSEVRRLICEELPELVGGYQKVPVELKRKPLHGGATPDQHLVEGLSTVDEELARMHSRLAVEDLHALATQQRYLDAKYKRGDKLK